MGRRAGRGEFRRLEIGYTVDAAEEEAAVGAGRGNLPEEFSHEQVVLGVSDGAGVGVEAHQTRSGADPEFPFRADLHAVHGVLRQAVGLVQQLRVQRGRVQDGQAVEGTGVQVLAVRRQRIDLGVR